jgi:hypothetical protein
LVTLRSHNLILHAGFARQLHPKVLYDLGKIGFEDQLRFQELYLSKKKSLNLAFICLLFFPGTHYAFMGKWQTQLLFWLTLGGGLVWWVIDFCRLKNILNESNFHVQQKILMEIKSVNVFNSVKPLVSQNMMPA